MVDTAGSIVNQYRYDEWGRITEQTETVPNEFKYAGETCDAETGLYYLRARYYDPDTGRFISKDSMEGDLWNPLSQNLYTYCENDPLGNVDPWGQAVKPLRELATQYQASRISYDWRTRTATITIGGTTRYFKATEEQARAGKIEIEESDFYKAFPNIRPKNGIQMPWYKFYEQVPASIANVTQITSKVSNQVSFAESGIRIRGGVRRSGVMKFDWGAMETSILSGYAGVGTNVREGFGGAAGLYVAKIEAKSNPIAIPNFDTTIRLNGEIHALSVGGGIRLFGIRNKLSVGFGIMGWGIGVEKEQ